MTKLIDKFEVHNGVWCLQHTIEQWSIDDRTNDRNDVDDKKSP